MFHFFRAMLDTDSMNSGESKSYPQKYNQKLKANSYPDHPWDFNYTFFGRYGALSRSSMGFHIYKK